MAEEEESGQRIDFLKDVFNEFLNDRMKSKKAIYASVSVFGLVIAFIATGMFILTSLALTPYIDAYSSTQSNAIIICIQSITTFLRVVGICIFSAVPTSELDILEILMRRRKVRIALSIFIGT